MSEEIEKLNSKVDALTALNNRILDILENVLIEADYLTKIKNLNENTISRNTSLEKFNEFGKRKLLIKLSDVTVVKNRKKRK